MNNTEKKTWKTPNLLIITSSNTLNKQIGVSEGDCSCRTDDSQAVTP